MTNLESLAAAGDPRAKQALFELEHAKREGVSLEVFRKRQRLRLLWLRLYDMEETVAKRHAAGLPTGEWAKMAQTIRTEIEDLSNGLPSNQV